MNITWKIISLEWVEELDSNEKVITNIHYWVDALESDSKGYNWGNIQLNTDNLTDFKPFESLTEEDCINWVKQSLDLLYGGSGVTRVEEGAKNMCLQQDPNRKRNFGVPW